MKERESGRKKGGWKGREGVLRGIIKEEVVMMEGCGEWR